MTNVLLLHNAAPPVVLITFNEQKEMNLASCMDLGGSEAALAVAFKLRQGSS